MPVSSHRRKGRAGKLLLYRSEVTGLVDSKGVKPGNGAFGAAGLARDSVALELKRDAKRKQFATGSVYHSGHGHAWRNKYGGRV